jgi:uncharacterized protein YkwD
MLRARFLWGVAGLLGSLGPGCSRTQAMREQSTTRPIPIAAAHYASAPGQKNASDDANERQLRSDVAEKLAEAGDHADSDEALDAAATWALNEGLEGRMIDASQAQWGLHHFGFAGELVSFATFKFAARWAWHHQLARESNLPITRYGVRVSSDGQLATVVLGRLELDLQPIPRILKPGESVVLTGRLGSRFSSSRVYLAKPDGSVEERDLPDQDLNATFTLTTPGKYRLEVMGDGAPGPVVLVNLPLHVGVPEPSPARIDGTSLSPEESKARLFVLLNQARQRAGQTFVESDAELEERALSHSVDMTQGNFFGHVSPTLGTLEERVRQAKLGLTALGELVGAGNNPEAVHDALLESPGHRAIMLRSGFTHVGIGVVPIGERIVVSVELGRRPPPSALPTSAGQIETAILELRARQGLPLAKADPVYRSAASSGAAALAGGADDKALKKAVEMALQREAERLQTERPASCIFPVQLLELSQLTAIKALNHPSLKRFGVGISGRSGPKGVSMVTVLICEGVPCESPSSFSAE